MRPHHTQIASNFGSAIMLLPDNIYRRIPQYWMLIGIAFVLLGLVAGSSYTLFPAYLGFGTLCIGRSVWIYQARWKHHHRNEMKILRSTQIIDRSQLDQSGK
jgi:hypothetical protein